MTGTNTLGCFIVFNRARIIAMRLSRPNLRTGERCVRLRLTVPLSLFDSEVPTVDVAVPEESKTQGIDAEPGLIVYVPGDAPAAMATPDAVT